MSNSTHIEQKKPIAAIATALGEAGISVIRVSGKEALDKVSTIFRGVDLGAKLSHTAHYGRIVVPDKSVDTDLQSDFLENEKDKNIAESRKIKSFKEDIEEVKTNVKGDSDIAYRVVDEVIVTIFRSPRSYTGEDIVEISCHGGVLITQEILEIILGLGIRHAEPGEFTLRAFLNGKLELAQAEAVADLIHAKSRKAVEAAGRQLEGALGRHIKKFRQQIIDVTALVELELDFIEEDVEFASRQELDNLLMEVIQEMNRLLETYESGRLVRHGVQTVFAGKPNAGKSTLLNTLMGKERAIVSATAGTTRDVIDADWSYDGLTFTLTDTAGLRETVDEVESEGVRRSESAVSKADLILYLKDVSEETDEEEERLLARIKEKTKNKVLLRIGTKIDLLPLNEKGFMIDRVNTCVLENDLAGEKNLRDREAKIGVDHVYDLVISAKEGIGINELKMLMKRQVLRHKEIDTRQPIITSSRHRDALQKARQNIMEALAGLRAGTTGDFLAIDLRSALNELGTITGEITTEDILDSVFSRFCIGK